MKPSCQIALEARLPCCTVALHRAACTNIRRSSQGMVTEQTIHLTVHRETHRRSLLVRKRTTLEGPRLVKFTLRSLRRPLLRVRIPMDSPRCHVPPTSQRGGAALPLGRGRKERINSSFRRDTGESAE